MNPVTSILQRMQSNPFLQGIGQMIGIAKMAQNPMGELQNNPQMKETLEFIQQNGGDARAVAYMLARQKG